MVINMYHQPHNEINCRGSFSTLVLQSTCDYHPPIHSLHLDEPSPLSIPIRRPPSNTAALVGATLLVGGHCMLVYYAACLCMCVCACVHAFFDSCMCVDTCPHAYMYLSTHVYTHWGICAMMMVHASMRALVHALIWEPCRAMISSPLDTGQDTLTYTKSKLDCSLE